jgi:hypothetical protein
MSELTERIADQMRAGLVWPGDPERGIKPRPIALPFAESTGRPKEMQDLINETVKQISEAIVAFIENDYELIPRGEASKLRYAAGESDVASIATPVYCRCDRKRSDPLVMLTITSADAITVDGPGLIRALSSREATCPHKAVK